MATITKRLLSGSTNGKAILVASTTAASGTILHTAVSGTTNFDEVWVYAQNLTSGIKRLIVNYQATASGDKVTYDLPVKQYGPSVVVPGYLAQNGNVIRAYATAANVISAHGYVHRIA